MGVLRGAFSKGSTLKGGQDSSNISSEAFEAYREAIQKNAETGVVTVRTNLIDAELARRVGGG